MTEIKTVTVVAILITGMVILLKVKYTEEISDLHSKEIIFPCHEMFYCLHIWAKIIRADGPNTIMVFYMNDSNDSIVVVASLNRNKITRACYIVKCLDRSDYQSWPTQTVLWVISKQVLTYYNNQLEIFHFLCFFKHPPLQTRHYMEARFVGPEEARGESRGEGWGTGGQVRWGSSQNA